MKLAVLLRELPRALPRLHGMFRDTDPDLAQLSNCFLLAPVQLHYYLAWENPMLKKRHLTLILQLALIPET